MFGLKGIVSRDFLPFFLLKRFDPPGPHMNGQKRFCELFHYFSLFFLFFFEGKIIIGVSA